MTKFINSVKKYFNYMIYAAKYGSPDLNTTTDTKA